MDEIWKPIEGTGNRFSISDMGRVRREACKIFHSGPHSYYQNISQRMLNPVTNGLKHQITLNWTDDDHIKHSPTYNVEVLVWRAFIGDPPNIYHINGDTLDDRLCNLSDTSHFVADVDEECEWRDIPGTNGYYQVSTSGHVRSCERYTKRSTGSNMFVPSQILNPYVDSNGYQVVYLRVDGSDVDWLVHRAVASAFIPNPNNYECVNHKNFITTDNYVDNLEWCSQSYNVEYSSKRGRYHVSHPHTSIWNRTTKSKPVICIETGQQFMSMTECDTFFSFPNGSTSTAVNSNKPYKGYHFKLA